MRMIDLFSGIGGFHYAAEQVWADVECLVYCEIDEYCQKVLKKHWPDVPIEPDIHKLDGTKYADVDLLTGGFPCQPYSVAGQRRGMEDDRALWPQMLRIIREAKPRWIIAENVSGFLSLNEGLEFENCLASLEDAGYEVQAFVIPACAVDAPHRRDRVWIVAHRDNGRRGKLFQQEQIGRSKKQTNFGSNGKAQPLADTNASRLQGITSEKLKSTEKKNGTSARCEFSGRNAAQDWQAGHTQSGLGRMATRFPDWLDRNIELFSILHFCILAYGTEAKTSTKKVLSDLWGFINSPKIQRQIGRLWGFPEKESLFTYLRKYQENSDEISVLLESKEISQKQVRSMWVREKSACSSHRPKLQEQFRQKPANTLYSLSQILARHAREAWVEYSRKDASPQYWLDEPAGIPRITTESKNRSARLKALGNSIVPQVAIQIMQAIKQVDRQIYDRNTCTT